MWREASDRLQTLIKSLSRCNTMFSLGLEMIRRLLDCNIR
jgi:hypothetical protein